MTSVAQAFRLFFGAIMLFCFAACSQRLAEPIVRETEEPIFRRAKEMLDRGLAPEALVNFSKLIIKRNGNAPESHLESGLIYLNHIKDPISAYYHFNKYKAIISRKQESSARKSSIARADELLKSARKELLAQFPSDVYKDPLERINFIDTIEALRSENNELKDSLSAAREKLRQRSTAPRYTPPQPIENTDSDPQTAKRETEPGDQPSIAQVEPPKPQIRFYTVQQGDSLYKISRQVYGDGGRWQEIMSANRAILPSVDRLQPGMRLRIP